MIAEFPLNIDYSQILVFLSSHPKPGLLWTDEHVSQGFAWENGIVSFYIPDHDDECLVRIMNVDSDDISEKSLWAIKVPFYVSETLKIGSVFDRKLINIPHGTYDLVFEVSQDVKNFTFLINLKFMKNNTPTFKILKKGGPIKTNEVIKKNAELAE